MNKPSSSEVLDALREMTLAFKPFTLRPIGGEGSQARLEQEEQKAVHAKAISILERITP